MGMNLHAAKVRWQLTEVSHCENRHSLSGSDSSG